MPRFSRAAAAACLAAFIPPALVALASRRVHGEFELPTLHVLAVTGTAAVAAAVSMLMTRAAIRRNDTRAGLVGVAFTVIAGLMTIHGLATPGVFLEEYAHNATVGLAGVLAVPAGGVILAAAVLVTASTCSVGSSNSPFTRREASATSAGGMNAARQAAAAAREKRGMCGDDRPRARQA